MRLNRLDLNLLVMLDALLTTRSVSETAQQMRLTQPAISNALARLRQHFEDELLVQVGRRMALTPFAEQLAAPVHAAITELKRISTMRGRFDPASAERNFCVLCSDYVFQVFITRVVRRLAELAPGISIMTYLTGDHAAELLNQGEADFAINPDVRLIADHPSVKLFHEEFSCIAWSGNSRLDGTISREQFLAAGHVSTCLGPTNPPHVEQDALREAGIARRIAVYAPNFTSVAEAVVGTDYVATIHARTARTLAQRMALRVMTPPIAIPPFAECLQWHRNKTADPGMVWMRDFLCECAAELEAEGISPGDGPN